MRKIALEPATGVWSHDLCSMARSDDDSNSDTGSPTAPSSASALSTDARLIQELDLSRRHDEALYKPNPWTIAKINAATRPQRCVDKLPPSKLVLTRAEPIRGQVSEVFNRSPDNGLPIHSKELPSCKYQESNTVRAPSDEDPTGDSPPLKHAAQNTMHGNTMRHVSYEHASYMHPSVASPSSKGARAVSLPTSEHRSCSPQRKQLRREVLLPTLKVNEGKNAVSSSYNDSIATISGTVAFFVHL